MLPERTTVVEYEGSMGLHHALLRGSNEAIGLGLGRLARDFHGVRRPTGTRPEDSSQQNAYLQEYYPAHFARMRGLAEAYGERLEDCTFDFSFFGRALGSTGCSAIHYPPTSTASGHGVICRNLDFSIPATFRQNPSPFPFKDTYLLELYPEGCFPSLTLFCFDLFGLPLEGINSEGLAVVHLADADTRLDHPGLPTGRTSRGFNEFLPIQYLLDTCSDTADAEAALEKMDHYCHAVPVHLLVADRSGRSFVFEYSPDAQGKVFVHRKVDSPLRVTNCQLNRLSDSMMRETLEARASENGIDRYRTLGRELQEAATPYSEPSIREINNRVLVHSETGSSLEATLFQCLYDTNASSVEVSLLPSLDFARERRVLFTLGR